MRKKIVYWKATPVKLIECPNCYGDGTVEEFYGCECCGNGEYEKEKCNRCSGFGKIFINEFGEL